MNILHLSAVKNWGGGENHIENLCRELKTLAPKVKNVVFCVQNSLFHKKLEDSGIEAIPAVLDFKMDPRYMHKLIGVCRKEKFDLIHIHDTTALTLAVMADHFYNLPPFILSKKTSFPIKPRKQTLFKYNYPKIKRILCVSRATEAITGLSVNDHEKLRCIYHGTAINVIQQPANVELKAILNLPNDAILVGNIANHIRAKCLQVFLHVAQELVHEKKLENLHFIQIGAFTGKTPELKEIVQKLKLSENVHFMGDIPDAACLIPQFDLSLITSQSEGLPQFIYESLYHRVPVVSTDVGGIKEIIKHNENGLLSPAHDVESLSKNILSLLECKELREKLCRNSRELIEKNYTSSIMAFKTLEEYKIVINGRN